MKRVIAVVALAAMTCAYAELSLTQKVADTRTPIVQPVQQDLPPEGAKVDKFVDQTPEIRPTAQETKTQMEKFTSLESRSKYLRLSGGKLHQGLQCFLRFLATRE